MVRVSVSAILFSCLLVEIALVESAFLIPVTPGEGHLDSNLKLQDDNDKAELIPINPKFHHLVI